MGAGEALGVGDGAGLGDDLQPLLVVDQQPQALAHDGVVVGDDDRGLVAVGALGAGARSVAVAVSVVMFSGTLGTYATPTRRNPGQAATSVRSFPQSANSRPAAPRPRAGRPAPGRRRSATSRPETLAEQHGRRRPVVARADHEQVGDLGLARELARGVADQERRLGARRRAATARSSSSRAASLGVVGQRAGSPAGRAATAGAATSGVEDA